jgi:hypothetical protein
MAAAASVSDRIRLILLSFLLLFVELALIRWTGSNIVYLSYFSNFVLLGSFLGIGIGFLRARARRDLFSYAPLALAALVVVVLRFPVEIKRPGGQLLYFGRLEADGTPIWVTLPVIFLAVAGTMALLAEGVARTFARFEPLEAYRLDIVGSIAGIAAFSVLAFLGLPPLAWGVVVAVTFLALLGRRARVLQVLALAVVVGALAWETRPSFDEPLLLSWSPYYKIHVEPHAQTFDVDVNGIPHQTMTSLAVVRAEEPLYLVPYQRRVAPPGDVLIVGAGTGTDVAVALAQGARSVDAVEIDPRLYELGRELHPNRPYDDPRVDVHIGDGRAFLERTGDRYDTILFALPDSLTLVAGQSTLRLESYLFTLQAMEAARDRLRPHGTLTMYNYYREQWLVDRLAGTLAEAFGRPPCQDVPDDVGRLALLTVSLDPAAVRCKTVWRPFAGAPSPVSDDYPFLYLRDRGLPSLYLVTIGLILAASLLAVRVTAGPFRAMRSYLDLFFLGAAFLLLETKNVVQFALLFGTTWFVNALVFGGILVAVLAAVEVSRRVRIGRPRLLYLALFVALTVAWAVPQDSILQLSWTPRLVAATVVAFLPIFLANLIFAQRFAGVGSSTVAFGANLLGAMTGGLLEYLSLLTGYRALLPLAGVLYALAFACRRFAEESALELPRGVEEQVEVG